MAIFLKRAIFKSTDVEGIGEFVKTVRIRLDIEDILYCEECDTDSEYTLVYIRGLHGIWVTGDIREIDNIICMARRDEELNLPNRNKF